MDREGVAQWLVRYVEAWKSNDPAVIEKLFAPEVTYRYEPYQEPDRGRDAVVKSWLKEPDRPGSWEASYEPVAVEGRVAVAKGFSRYLASNGNPERIYHNVFLISFDDDGRCIDFVEYYMHEPPAEA
jgi:hypothetical protein